VLLEAMAARLPVITTRIAGVPELVAHGKSGLLVAPGDEDALRDALAKILGDADLRRAMGEAGHAKVLAEFTSEAEGAWLAELFRGYAAGNPPAAKRPGIGT
jgi:glycosyltransferase involved in cell wall biosynthesis